MTISLALASLLNGTFTVLVNGRRVKCILLPISNSNSSYLCFIYSHSTEQIIIIREFPLLLILPLFIIATFPAIMIYKKKGVRTSQS